MQTEWWEDQLTNAERAAIRIHRAPVVCISHEVVDTLSADALVVYVLLQRVPKTLNASDLLTRFDWDGWRSGAAFKELAEAGLIGGDDGV